MTMAGIVAPQIDAHVMALIRMAVDEDLGRARAGGGGVGGDNTVELAIPAEVSGAAKVVARRVGTISGGFLIAAILAEYDAALTCEVHAADGARVSVNEAVATIRGPVRGILSAERVVLNFLGHMSGIATLTRRYVEAVGAIKPAPAICDTRKTTPGFRVLDKYAVRCGGGVNHRMGLYDGVMLKDNHLAALRERLGEGGMGTLAYLTSHVRGELDPKILLWLEVDTLEQLNEVLHNEGIGPGPDIILLDNFTPDKMKQAVQLRDRAAAWRGQADAVAHRILLEASGGITLENIDEVARTGVDRISIGALTHSAPVLDVSMEFDAAASGKTV